MRTVKKKKENPFMKNFGLSSFALDSLMNPTYEWVEEPVETPINFSIKNNLDYDYIKVSINSNCKCLTNREIIFIPFYNNNSILLAFNKIHYSYSGIEETSPNFTRWESLECDPEDLVTRILSEIEDFQNNEAEDIFKFLEKNKSS